MGDGIPATADFGRQLRALRTHAGLTQEELAHAAGVSVRAVADLERGRAKGPQRRTVQAMAEALGLDADDAQNLERAAQLGRPRPRRSATPPAYNTLALPRDIQDFTARGPALAELVTLAENTDPGHPPVVVISGQPGLGKTSFAVHAAHHLAAHFPDGQFALDLHGMNPEPTAPREALGRLLRALGLAERAVPLATDDRSGLLRSVLRERRVLILLDNAVDESQVRPLLPGAGPSLTIVTSRHTLAGLEAVHRSELALLKREEAVQLLTRIIGTKRVQEEAQSARDLVDLCGHLPLAVRIAGQRLAGRPHEHLGKLVAQLDVAGRRLDTLQAGGLRVRAAFALSYEQLPPPTRTLLRRAALAAGTDFSPEAAALLAEQPIEEAARCAEELADAGLLLPDPGTERYRFHDLLRLFAAERLSDEDGAALSEAAQDRTAQWMLRRATAAALRFDAARHQDAPDGDPDPARAPADRAQARAWLEAEQAQWFEALRRSQATGRHQQVLDAAEAMHWFSDLTQHWELWPEVFQLAVDAARALASRQDEVVHLNYLAWAHNTCVYDHHAALQAAGTALAVAREIDDQLQMGWALGYGAAALYRLGRLDEAIVWLQDSAACLSGQTSPQSRLAELSTLNILGNYLRESGRAEEALAIHRRSEAICRTGMPGQSPELISLYQAAIRQHLGNDLAALGQRSDAEVSLRKALATFEAAQMLSWSEPARLDLALVLRQQARYQEAREELLAAQDSLGELNSPRQAEAAAELREVDQAIAGPGTSCS
ncbi:helix-turn-helix domain-containing protein [Streptomyces sp. NBC_00358]|uniref:helix-turn-helix domain-containing protein n=1 Tax=Streptomyces sp. NBC_00358 TaxID=2975725 RepID=UPI002E27724B